MISKVLFQPLSFCDSVNDSMILKHGLVYFLYKWANYIVQIKDLEYIKYKFN